MSAHATRRAAVAILATTAALWGRAQPRAEHRGAAPVGPLTPARVAKPRIADAVANPFPKA